MPDQYLVEDGRSFSEGDHVYVRIGGRARGFEWSYGRVVGIGEMSGRRPQAYERLEEQAAQGQTLYDGAVPVLWQIAGSTDDDVGFFWAGDIRHADDPTLPWNQGAQAPPQERTYAGSERWQRVPGAVAEAALSSLPRLFQESLQEKAPGTDVWTDAAGVEWRAGEKVMVEYNSGDWLAGVVMSEAEVDQGMTQPATWLREAQTIPILVETPLGQRAGAFHAGEILPEQTGFDYRPNDVVPEDYYARSQASLVTKGQRYELLDGRVFNEGDHVEAYSNVDQGWVNAIVVAGDLAQDRVPVAFTSGYWLEPAPQSQEDYKAEPFVVTPQHIRAIPGGSLAEQMAGGPGARSAQTWRKARRPGQPQESWTDESGRTWQGGQTVTVNLAWELDNVEDWQPGTVVGSGGEVDSWGDYWRSRGRVPVRTRVGTGAFYTLRWVPGEALRSPSYSGGLAATRAPRYKAPGDEGDYVTPDGQSWRIGERVEATFGNRQVSCVIAESEGHLEIQARDGVVDSLPVEVRDEDYFGRPTLVGDEDTEDAKHTWVVVPWDTVVRSGGSPPTVAARGAQLWRKEALKEPGKESARESTTAYTMPDGAVYEEGDQVEWRTLRGAWVPGVVVARQTGQGRPDVVMVRTAYQEPGWFPEGQSPEEADSAAQAGAAVAVPYYNLRRQRTFLPSSVRARTSQAWRRKGREQDSWTDEAGNTYFSGQTVEVDLDWDRGEEEVQHRWVTGTVLARNEIHYIPSLWMHQNYVPVRFAAHSRNQDFPYTWFPSQAIRSQRGGIAAAGPLRRKAPFVYEFDDEEYTEGDEVEVLVGDGDWVRGIVVDVPPGYPMPEDFVWVAVPSWRYTGPGQLDVHGPGDDPEMDKAVPISVSIHEIRHVRGAAQLWRKGSTPTRPGNDWDAPPVEGESFDGGYFGNGTVYRPGDLVYARIVQASYDYQNHRWLSWWYPGVVVAAAEWESRYGSSLHRDTIPVRFNEGGATSVLAFDPRNVMPAHEGPPEGTPDGFAPPPEGERQASQLWRKADQEPVRYTTEDGEVYYEGEAVEVFQGGAWRRAVVASAPPHSESVPVFWGSNWIADAGHGTTDHADIQATRDDLGKHIFHYYADEIRHVASDGLPDGQRAVQDLTFIRKDFREGAWHDTEGRSWRPGEAVEVNFSGGIYGSDWRPGRVAGPDDFDPVRWQEHDLTEYVSVPVVVEQTGTVYWCPASSVRVASREHSGGIAAAGPLWLKGQTYQLSDGRTFQEGQRVEVHFYDIHYHGNWRPGTVVAQSQDDPRMLHDDDVLVDIDSNYLSPEVAKRSPAIVSGQRVRLLQPASDE